jgi:hypothetical protein
MLEAQKLQINQYFLIPVVQFSPNSVVHYMTDCRRLIRRRPPKKDQKNKNTTQKSVHYIPESAVHYIPDFIVHYIPKYSIRKRKYCRD